MSCGESGGGMEDLHRRDWKDAEFFADEFLHRRDWKDAEFSFSYFVFDSADLAF